MSSSTSSPPFSCLNCANIPPIDPQFLTCQMQQANYTRAITSRPLRITQTHTHTDRSNLSLIKDIDHIASTSVCIPLLSADPDWLLRRATYKDDGSKGTDKIERTKGYVGIQRRKWEGTQHESPGKKRDKPGVSKSVSESHFHLHIGSIC